MTLQKEDLVRGELYEFLYQGTTEPNPLVYIGKEGNWYQFEQVGNRGVVWAEVLESDLRLISKIEGIDEDLFSFTDEEIKEDLWAWNDYQDSLTDQ